MYICFHPEVRGWPLILGDDAEGPSTETNILAQELNKLHSSDQTTTTVQNSWYCTIIRRKPINNEYYSNIRSVDVNNTHMWVLEGVVWLRWAPQACVHPGSPPRGSPRSLPESLERSGLCTYSSSLGRQHHPHLGISLPKHTRSVPSFQILYILLCAIYPPVGGAGVHTLDGNSTTRNQETTNCIPETYHFILAFLLDTVTDSWHTQFPHYQQEETVHANQNKEKSSPRPIEK